jgi:undecaprenyl-diphosphatase
MALIHSLILGLIEGFTEFLPVSSTAHLILASDILGLDQSAFVKTFEIVIQSGAILAVIVLYWKKFLDVEILKKVIAAFIPTAIIGYILYKLVKNYLIGNITVVLWALAIGGVILIAFDYFFKPKQNYAAVNDIKSLTYGKAVTIGLVQAIAIIPGVSRSAATIIGGSFAGMSREAVVEFSFLLAVPTILAATGLDLVKNINSFSADQTGTLLIGFIAAFVTALMGIKFLLSFIRSKSWVWFGVYRLAIVTLFVLFLSGIIIVPHKITYSDDTLVQPSNTAYNDNSVWTLKPSLISADTKDYGSILDLSYPHQFDNWKLYINKKYQYQFKYPANWSIYSEKDDGVTLKTPENTVAFVTDVCKESFNPDTNLIEVCNYTAVLPEYFKERYAYPSYTNPEDNYRSVQIGGLAGYEYIDNSGAISTHNFIVLHDGRAYEMYSHDEGTWETLPKITNDVVSTFRFLK